MVRTGARLPSCTGPIFAVYPLAILLSSHWIYKLPEKRKKTATLAVRMEPFLKEAAERAANEDHRSLTQLFEKILTDYLVRKGYLVKGRD